MNIGNIGAAGEQAAQKYLKKHRYRILSCNYQTKFGEIDIVCCNKDFIVFAEVKTRSENYLVSGREAVDSAKQGRLIRCAFKYLQENPTELQPRFDVLEIVTCRGKAKEISHIENAFPVEGYHGFL